MPLHVLDNLTNLSDTAIARSNIGLGAEDSPEFYGLTATGDINFVGGVDFTTNIGGEFNLTAPTIDLTSTNGIVNVFSSLNTEGLTSVGSANIQSDVGKVFSSSLGMLFATNGFPCVYSTDGTSAPSPTGLNWHGVLFDDGVSQWKLQEYYDESPGSFWYGGSGSEPENGTWTSPTESDLEVNIISQQNILNVNNTAGITLNSEDYNNGTVSINGVNGVTIGGGVLNFNSSDFVYLGSGALTHRISLGLGTTDSPTFSSITTSATIASPKYTVTNTNGDISTTKSVTTWEFGTKTFSVNTQATAPRGIDFNNTGTRVFVLNSTAGAIGVYQYDLSPSSPWDITTAVYNSVSKSITGVPLGIKFSTDGLYMFISNDTGDTVVRYTLVTPWDLNTVSVNPDQTYTLTNATNGVSTLTVPKGINFSPDGTRMYVTDDSQNSVYQFNLVTPWSVNTAVYSGNSIFFNASPVNESSPQHAVISSDGTRLIITGATSDRIWEYTLPTPYSLAGAFLHGPMRRDLISVSFVNLPIAEFPESSITGIYYNDVLNKCFYIGTDTRRIQEIDVTPQMLITGTRPVIRGIDTGRGFGSEMVRMNGLYITGLPAGTLSNGGGGLVVNGQIGCGGLSAVNFGISGGSFNVNGADGTVGWNGRSTFRSPANGSISMTAQSGNFRILRWGLGVDSSTPAIRRAETGVGLQVTTGTDTFSDFADLTAKNITATATLSGLNFVAGGNALSTSGGFSLALSHLGRVIRYNDASAIIVTVPDQSTVSWPDGSLIYLRRNTGAGTITIQGSGATIINDNASASVPAGSMMAIRRVTTDQWDFI